jgi:hypothetical protein
LRDQTEFIKIFVLEKMKQLKEVCPFFNLGAKIAAIAQGNAKAGPYEKSEIRNGNLLAQNLGVAHAGRSRSPLRAVGCQRARSDDPRRGARSDAPHLRAGALECGGPPPLLDL